METGDSLLSDSRSRRHWLVPTLVAGLALLAYRPLWIGVRHFDIDGALFRPGELPILVVLVVAGWLLWMRRTSLRSVTAAPAPLLALSLATFGSGLFVWALRTGKVDLLLPSLAAHALAWLAAARGRSGCRAALLPSLVLLFGVRLPKPIENEIVWQLQRWTAQGSGWLLDAVGRDFVQAGVILRSTDHTFHVIDSCSGLNGIAILTVVALIVRELFKESGRRTWLLVGLAPVMALPLNMIRVAYVAASPNPEALAGLEGDHTSQGLAVVMAGTGILYALGWAMTRGTLAASRPAGNAHTDGRRNEPVLWAITTLWLAALAVLSLTLPPFSNAVRTFAASNEIDFPDQKPGWTSEPGPHDLYFTGVFSRGLFRRFNSVGGPRRPRRAVDLLVGYVDPNRPTATRLMSSKLLVPGPEWHLTRRSDKRLWTLDREVEWALASRAPSGEQAVIYAWRPRDAGIWWESWRALLALDSSPFRRKEPRGAVRLIAYAQHDGQLALDRAKQQLDRFVVRFREELAAL
jgi:exosortase